MLRSLQCYQSSRALRLQGSAALRLCGPKALRLCGSAALRLYGSTALRLYYSSDLRLYGSTELKYQQFPLQNQMMLLKFTWKFYFILIKKYFGRLVTILDQWLEFFHKCRRHDRSLMSKRTVDCQRIRSMLRGSYKSLTGLKI